MKQLELSRNYPSFLVLPVTDRCYCHCVMCGIWKKESSRDISLSVIKTLLTDLSLAKNLKYINITGGEPLLYSKLDKIIEIICHSCSNLRELSINTSGIPADICQSTLTKILPLIPAHARFVLTISLDGDLELHNRIRGNSGAMQELQTFLGNIRNYFNLSDNLSLHVNTTISNKNIAHPDKIALALSKINIPFTITCAAYNKLYLNNKSSVSRISSINEWEYFLDSLKKSLYSYKIKLIRSNDHFLHMLSKILAGEKRPYPCVFAENGIFLDIDTQLYPCGTSENMCYGSILDHTFEELFFSETARIIRSQLREEICSSCISNSYYAHSSQLILELLKVRNIAR